MPITKRFARVLDAKDKDNTNGLAALRLQAKAWRLLTFIAIHDPERAKREAKWLMMHTLPFVDGEAVGRFIDERQELAEQYALDSGTLVGRVGHS